MEPIKINLTTKISGVKELTVKSIVERDNELVIELYGDESYFIKEGMRLRFTRQIYVDGTTNETIFEYVDVLYKDEKNRIHTTTIAPKKVQLFTGGEFVKKKTWIEEVYYISTKEPHNIYPQDILLGEPEFVIKNYSGDDLITLTKDNIKVPNEYGDGYITSADCVSFVEEIKTCGKRYNKVDTFAYNFLPSIVSKNCLIVSGLTDTDNGTEHFEEILNEMSYIEVRQNRFYYSYIDVDDKGIPKEYDNFGNPVKICRLYTDPWWAMYEEITKRKEGKIYTNVGNANSILCYEVDYWATDIGLSSPVNESTLGSLDNFNTKFVEDLEQSLIPDVIDMERVKYSPVVYSSNNKEKYFKLVSKNDEKYPIIYTNKWINVKNGLNNGDIVDAYVIKNDKFEKITDVDFFFDAYAISGGYLYRDEIDKYDKTLTTYTYYPTEEVINDALTVATSVTISMHFRKRNEVDPKNNVNTNLTSGNVYTDGWFIAEDDNLATWWNGFDYDKENFNANIFETYFRTSGITSDLIGYLNFTDNDIFYRKKKVSQSFLRFSFYNSNDPIEQKLLFYSTSFLDSTSLYGKYLKQMMFMEENGLFDVEGVNPNAAVVLCSADTVSSRVDTKMVLTNEYDRTKSSEGFNIYLFSEDKNLNLENGEKTIYMKVEFNHAGNGKTIPLIMWPKDESGKYIALTIDNFIENLYIPIKLTYIDGKYVYYIPNAINNDNGNIDLVLFEPKLDFIDDADLI